MRLLHIYRYCLIMFFLQKVFTVVFFCHFYFIDTSKDNWKLSEWELWYSPLTSYITKTIHYKFQVNCVKRSSCTCRILPNVLLSRRSWPLNGVCTVSGCWRGKLRKISINIVTRKIYRYLTDTRHIDIYRYLSILFLSLTHTL